MAWSTLRLVALALGFPLAGCVGSSSSAGGTPPGIDAGGSLDATVPSVGDDGGTGIDATTEDSAVAAEAGPIVWGDAGTGCNPPAGGSVLSAAGEGLPASGLVLWLRGDQGLYTMPQQGDAGDAGGPAVCAWGDVSGNGWLLTAQTTTLPTLSPAGVGGQPAVWINGGGTLQTSGVLGIPATSPRTFVAVEALVSAGGRFDPIIQGESGTPGTYIAIDANTWDTAGNLEGVYMPSNSMDSNTATSAGAVRVHVFTVTSMTAGTAFSTAIDYRVNGVSQTLTVKEGNGLVQDFSGANFTAVVAPLSTSTGLPSSGMVAEVLVYDRALAVSERQTVESVLEARYGIH